jgi:bacillithiol biosynthesis deacetylase BshB1
MSGIVTAMPLATVDLLVFGPHPDDIEIGFGGSVALHVARGFSVGLCDLTQGELGSNGTVEERLAEAETACQVLGAAWRVNFGWPDGGVYDTPGHVEDVVRLVRTVRPRAVAIPYWQDRHPDHRAASEALSRAVFKCGLRKFVLPAGDPGAALEPWRPERLCYYFINDDAPVSFGLDVSAVYEQKRAALDCHRTQFTPAGAGAVATRLTAPTFRQMIESRDALLGARTGVAFAEGVVVREPLLCGSLFD